jgi:hypothetical protein
VDGVEKHFLSVKTTEHTSDLAFVIVLKDGKALFVKLVSILGPYINTHCITAICELGCGNGTCVAPNQCECFEGWNGTFCENGT